MLAKYNFYSFVKCLIFYKVTIKFDFRFSSVKLLKFSKCYILVIWLWARFNILKEFNSPKPYIFEILFACKSNTSNFTSSFIFFILVSWFLGRSRTFMVGTPVDKFYISFIWLSNKSRYNKLCKDIKFYIFWMWLCWNVSIFSFYYP